MGLSAPRTPFETPFDSGGEVVHPTALCDMISEMSSAVPRDGGDQRVRGTRSAHHVDRRTRANRRRRRQLRHGGRSPQVGGRRREARQARTARPDPQDGADPVLVSGDRRRQGPSAQADATPHPRAGRRLLPQQAARGRRAHQLVPPPQRFAGPGQELLRGHTHLCVPRRDVRRARNGTRVPRRGAGLHLVRSEGFVERGPTRRGLSRDLCSSGWEKGIRPRSRRTCRRNSSTTAPL